VYPLNDHQKINSINVRDEGEAMYQTALYTIPEAAGNLGVSEALIKKFISRGLVMLVNDGLAPKLTSYNMRRLIRVVDLYEKSYPLDRIETILNQNTIF
jgi:hypothetical protein